MTKSYMTTFRGGAASTAAPVKVGRTPAEFQPCPPSVRLQYVSVRRLPSSFASANRFGLARSRLSSTPLLRPPVRRSVTRAADGQTDGRGSERERGHCFYDIQMGQLVRSVGLVVGWFSTSGSPKESLRVVVSF